MNSKKSKIRTSSYFYIGIFVVAIILLSIISLNIVIKYKQNQDLIAEKNRLENELEHIKDIDANVNEGYYVVYAEGEYALDINGDIVVIYK